MKVDTQLNIGPKEHTHFVQATIIGKDPVTRIFADSDVACEWCKRITGQVDSVMLSANNASGAGKHCQWTVRPMIYYCAK